MLNTHSYNYRECKMLFQRFNDAVDAYNLYLSHKDGNIDQALSYLEHAGTQLGALCEHAAKNIVYKDYSAKLKLAASEAEKCAINRIIHFQKKDRSGYNKPMSFHDIYIG